MFRCLQSHLKFREAAFFTLKYRFSQKNCIFRDKTTYFRSKMVLFLNNTIEFQFFVNKNVITLWRYYHCVVMQKSQLNISVSKTMYFGRKIQRHLAKLSEFKQKQLLTAKQQSAKSNFDHFPRIFRKNKQKSKILSENSDDPSDM